MKGLITISYRKVIDSKSHTPWEREVFEATSKEFFMQAQEYDRERKFETFADMIANIPRAKEMHYLVSTAAVHSIRKLDGKVPDIVDAQMQRSITFKNFKFEIIGAHVRDRSKHQVCITFVSDAYCWIDTIDRDLLLARAEDEVLLKNGQEVMVNHVSLNLGVSVYSFLQRGNSGA